MAYALRYQVQVFFVGSGAGPMSALTAPSLAGTGGGTGQSKEFNVTASAVPIAAGGGTANAINATDVTNLTNSMAADIAAQMNAAIGTLQGWVSGNP